MNFVYCLNNFKFSKKTLRKHSFIFFNGLFIKFLKHNIDKLINDIKMDDDLSY